MGAAAFAAHDGPLLYRHRFVDESYANGWSWLYLTLVGAIVGGLLFVRFALKPPRVH
jgi:hypothetical protein